jgi:hypothetical protein
VCEVERQPRIPSIFLSEHWMMLYACLDCRPGTLFSFPLSLGCFNPCMVCVYHARIYIRGHYVSTVPHLLLCPWDESPTWGWGVCIGVTHGECRLVVYIRVCVLRGRHDKALKAVREKGDLVDPEGSPVRRIVYPLPPGGSFGTARLASTTLPFATPNSP